ncbi:MAG: energy transducer TonB [Saprospiraceae bacterium]|nr:energy transducer TonB [Saprospiraceae bacterium]MBK7809746.1 energy transducer TonB [Saprospiraceae bacterium]MBK9632144.1 energy transducer TonB [Saprospiraceae bacterium]
MSQNLLPKFVMDDIVFDNRNQAYGAHYLRRIYDRIMSRSLVIGLIFFVLLVSSPMILKMVRSFIPKETDELLLKEVILAEPPPIDPNKPPPPPPPKVDPPPIKDQIRFVPPKVMKDEEVEIEEPPPPDITELADKDISTENREGDDDGVDASLVEPPPVVEEVVPEKPFDFVEQMPEFPDGQAAMMKYIQSNMKYPAIARENDIQGTVVLQFVVGPDGGISKVKVARGIGGGCDEEAMRVVRSMPKWRPGKHNGKAVPVNFTLPIKFRLE